MNVIKATVVETSVFWGPLIILITWIIHPEPRTAGSWFLFAGSCALAVGTIIARYIGELREREAETACYTRLLSLVDVDDFDHHGHIEDFFTPSECEQLIEELQSMPVGARSLRAAIKKVSPSLLDPNA